MKYVRYDPQADALYIDLSDAAIEESEEIEPGVVLDYDRQGNLIGIEVLDFWKRLSGLDAQEIEEGPA